MKITLDDGTAVELTTTDEVVTIALDVSKTAKRWELHVDGVARIDHMSFSPGEPKPQKPGGAGGQWGDPNRLPGVLPSGVLRDIPGGYGVSQLEAHDNGA